VKINAISSGCVVHKGKDVAVYAIQESATPERTSFYARVGSKWMSYDVKPEWTASAMAGARYDAEGDLVIVGASADGRTWELNPGSTSERLGSMGNTVDGITRLANIANAIWACGMGRTVLRRDAFDRWSDHSAPPGRQEDGIVGFTSIAGLGAEGMVAVGWRGEIWVFDGTVWTLEGSPTNSNFNDVSVGADGTVVVVGDKGGLVIGRPGQWRSLEISTTLNLQGVCHFGDEVFICSSFELFRLIGDDLMRETRYGEAEPPGTCMNLEAGAQSVFSQGEKDIYKFESGQWSRVL